MTEKKTDLQIGKINDKYIFFRQVLQQGCSEGQRVLSANGITEKEKGVGRGCQATKGKMYYVSGQREGFRR